VERINKMSVEERKNFAKNQTKFLKDKGVTDITRISRIFKAAGPGQIQDAWALASQATTTARKDLLDCLLTGVCGSQDFGKDRMEDVLRLAGFSPPKTNSESAFLRMLDGALEILVPGAYEFSEEELKEINNVPMHKMQSA